MKTRNPYLKRASLAAGLVCVLSFTSLPAAPVIYEPFAQSAGAIGGKAGGAGLGTWTAGTLASTVDGTGLTYSGLTTNNGKLTVDRGAAGAYGAYNNSGATLSGLLADGATMWFSFLYQYPGAASINSHGGFGLGTCYLKANNGNPTINAGSGILVYIKNDNTVLAGYCNGGTTTVSGTSLTASASATPTLVVGRITWNSTGSQTLTVWVNPTTGTPPTSSGSSITVPSMTQSGFTVIGTGQKGDAGKTLIFDEIRFGATYQDVVGGTAATAYWDTDGTTAGAGGATPSGTWDASTTSAWSGDSTGASASTTWTAGGKAVFAAGTDATGAYGVTVDGTPSFGGLLVEEGTPTISGGTALDLTVEGGTLEVRPTLSATVSTPITQTTTGGSLIKQGSGTLTLSGNNTYACPTFVHAGKLVLAGDNSGSSSAVAISSGAVTQFNSTSAVPSTGRTVTVNSGSAAMFDTLSDADIATCMGRIVTASAGTIAADNNGIKAFNFNTAGLTAASLGAVGSVSYTGALTPNSTAKYRLGGGGGALTLPNANQLSGAGNTLTVVGPGTVTLASANSPSSVAINSGATLIVQNSGAMGSGGIPATFLGTLILGSNLTGGQMIFTTGAVMKSDGTSPRTISNVTLANANNTVILGDATDNGKLTFNAAAGNKLSSSGYTFQCNSDVEFATGFQNATTGFTKTGTGTMTISGMAGTTGYSGSTTVSNGTLAGITANAFGSTSGISIAAAGTLSLRGDSDTTFVKKNDGTTRISVSPSASGATINVDQATVAGTSPKTMTLGTLGTSSTANAYTVNFTGANSTSLSLGAMTGPANASTTTKGTVTINNTIASPGTLTLASYTSTNAGSGAGAGETVTFTGSGTTTVTGAITPSATVLAVRNSGTGTLILSGDNSSMTGGVTLTTSGTGSNSPKLHINSATALGTGTLAFGGGAASDTVQIDNSSVGPITVSTANAMSLNRDFTFLGTRDLDLGTGTATIGGISAPGSRSITVNASTLTFGGIIAELTSPLGITKKGAGTLTFAGNNSYTGPTAVNDGTLLVNGSTDANSAVTVGANGTLGGSGTINGTLDVTAGGATQIGASSATLNLANSTAPTYNQSGATYAKLKLAASAATLDKISASAITGNSVANVDMVIDTTGLAGSVPSTVIYQAGGAITGPFNSVSFSANPGGYVATLDYSVSGQISLSLSAGGGYTVTYDDNDSTGGSVPVDGNSYATGAPVTVLGNTGSLVKSGFVFTGWNTQADGFGTHYNPADIFNMGSSNVTLYAEWKTPYQVWAGVAAFGGDDNGDGVSNGLAFLLGAANPSADALGLLPDVVEDNGQLVLTFSCLNGTARGAAVLDVQYSNDVGQTDLWTTNSAAVPGSATPVVPPNAPTVINGVTFEVTAGVGDLLDVTATVDAGNAAGGKLFGRLSGSP